MDLALNNRKWLICYKTKPNQIKLSRKNKHLKTDHYTNKLIIPHIKQSTENIQQKYSKT